MKQALAVVALLFVLAVPLASPAAAATEVEVTTPAGGRFISGSVTPLFVTIRADGARSGLISVSFEGQTTIRQPFDVPGGSTKRIIVLTPTPPWSSGGNLVVDTGDETISQRLDLIRSRDEELVGVLPDLAARELPATAELTVDIGQARLFPIDMTTFEAGAGVLRSFTYVVGSPDDLMALDPLALEAVSEWVNDGGRLVVDGLEDSTLPAQLTPDATSGQHRLGLGSVTYTDGHIASGGFDGTLAPTPTTSPEDLPFGGFFGMPATPTLAADAGVRVPAIGAIVLFLLGYAVIGGPIAYIIMRRTNREPALWLIIPALAVIATAGVWIFGRQLRDNVTSAHGTLVVDLPSGQVVSTQVLVSSPNGGWAGVALPDGWRPGARNFDDLFMGMEFGNRQGSATALLRDGDLEVELPPGGISVINAETNRTAAEADRSWNLELELVDDSLVGTITNLTEHRLERVSVSSGKAFQQVDDLGPGESAEVSLADPGGIPIQDDPLMNQLWEQDVNRPNSSPINPSVFGNWLSSHPTVRGQGNVLVIGWTREPVGPLTTTGGQVVAAGRTGYMAVEPISSAPGAFSPASNQIAVLRGFEGTQVTDQPRGLPDIPLTFQVTPAGAVDDSDRLVLEVPRFVASLDLWDGTSWQPAGMQSVPSGEGVVIALPAEALRDGSLYVRFQLGENWWGARSPFPILRTEAADDQTVELEPADA